MCTGSSSDWAEELCLRPAFSPDSIRYHKVAEMKGGLPEKVEKKNVEKVNVEKIIKKENIEK